MIDNISWLAIYPEIVLLVMACVIALVDLGVGSTRRTATYVLTMLSLAVVAVMQAMYASSGNTFYGWGNMVVSDAMGNWLKCFATVSLMVTLVYGRSYALDRGMLRGGELFTLTMLALLGICVLISANNFIVIYLGLELLTLSSYALVALRRDHTTATEAAMKYFVLGAMASGFLLYGLSMVYGATGSLDIGQVFKAINAGQIRHQVLVFGVVFIVAGLAFKFGAVPFHMWIPDVYQGAPTVVTLIIGSAPKFAAFAMAIRLLVDGLLPLAIDWQQMLAVLAIASLLVGNVAGVLQTNLKRMLAYSTIAQIGFVFLGLMAGDEFGNTRFGNNNPYCQDNEISWLNWDDLKKNHDLFEFCKFMIAFRRKHEPITKKTPDCDYGFPEVSEHDTTPWAHDFSGDSHYLGIMYAGRTRGKNDIIYLAVNTYWEDLQLSLPELPNGSAWSLVVDTFQEKSVVKPRISSGHETIGARSVMIFTAK